MCIRDRYQRRRYDRGGIGEGIDGELEGGENSVPSSQPQSSDRKPGGPEAISISYSAAYNACTSHARDALADRGYILAAPARPETAEDLGGAYKITARVKAQDKSGESWSRDLYCETAGDRVFLLELI